jgi:uncharacterized protein (TIGR02246 family)
MIKAEMEMTMLRLALIASIFMVAAPAFGQDKGHIQMLNDRFAEAFNKGDIATVAGMYTDDAFVLPAGSPMVRGRDAIQTLWKGGAELFEGMQLTTVDVLSLGNDAAREVGTFVLKTKGQSPKELEGKYVVIWQKVGSDWKLATDIWNANK